jgi:hypothetical protein
VVAAVLRDGGWCNVTKVLKSALFWDITPCSLVKAKGDFGGIFYFNLQDRRVSCDLSQELQKTNHDCEPLEWDVHLTWPLVLT